MMAAKSSGLGLESASVQDYVKTIYALSEWHDAPVTASRLASRLTVANSSVSEMIRKLADLGLVNHRPYRPIELTPAGLRLALAMVRRHRLIEAFLVSELGYRWDEVHDEAELLEHTVSDIFIDRLDAKLGFPEVDPHGDPIPTAEGTITLPDALPLHRLDQGHAGKVARISDENPDLLRFLANQEIGIGSPMTVLQRKPFGGPLQARVDIGHSSRDIDFGDELTEAIWVQSIGEHAGCSVVP